MKKIAILLALLGTIIVPGLQASEMSQAEKNAELLRAINAGDDAAVERVLDLKADANRTVNYGEKGILIGPTEVVDPDVNITMSILNYALLCRRTKSAHALLQHKADPTVKRYNTKTEEWGKNTLYTAISWDEKISLLLLLDPKIDSGAIRELYNAQLVDSEYVRDHLTQQRRQLYYADMIRLKKLLSTITPIFSGPAGIVAAYAAKYEDIPEHSLLLDTEPTPWVSPDAQEALDLAEELYFGAPSKKPKINKEEIQQKILELTMAGDFVEAQRLSDLLHGKG